MQSLKFNREFLTDFEQSSKREYLETNNLGVYASSTLSGVNSRKYHGVLVVRQPQIDSHSYVLVNCLHETVNVNENIYELGVHQYPLTAHPTGYLYLKEFKLEKMPTWIYEVEGLRIKKELLCADHANQVLIRYTLLDGDSIEIGLRPFSSFRRIHKLRAYHQEEVSVVEVENGMTYCMEEPYDSVFIQTSSENEFFKQKDWHYKAEYLVELERGYDFREDLFSAGLLLCELKKGKPVVVSLSTLKVKPKTLLEKFEKEVSARNTQASLEDYLEKAAQQFLTKTNSGTEVCAGYHWFGRWGRDTFLSLPGLTIARNQPEVCKQVLKTMLKDLKGGLLTNIGVGKAARYNSADASLWFFWALQEYTDLTESWKETWGEFKEEIIHILTHYKKGTMYNIHMDDSGLLYGGQKDVALTWMDAMVDGLPVTPRAGFTVELNALWYHAISFSLELAGKSKDASFVAKWEDLPQKIKKNFKTMFWNQDKGYLADACDKGIKDWSFRPNQVFATSLKYSVCDREMSGSILKKVEEKLLTPRGLRTLAQDDPKYIGIYQGNQRVRDLSYHQGIVWPWLLGHFVAGNLKIFGESALPLCRKIYHHFEDALDEYGLGTIAEIYDAEPPYSAKGTISQAWSVSELIRIKTLIDQCQTSNK